METPETTDTERGQATILMTGVVAIALVAMVVIALVGQAMIHRQRARTAADSVALAAGADSVAGDQLATWYRSQGVRVAISENRAWTHSGPSQAAAWAGPVTQPVETAPVLRAIIARIEQLRSHNFATVSWGRTWFIVGSAEAGIVASVAAEFGLCELHDSDMSASRRFQVC